MMNGLKLEKDKQREGSIIKDVKNIFRLENKWMTTQLTV